MDAPSHMAASVPYCAIITDWLAFKVYCGRCTVKHNCQIYYII